jgi:hypothetical protein
MFPLVVALGERFGRVTLVCQGQIGRLAVALKIAAQHLPFEAGMWSSLYSRTPDDRVVRLISAQRCVILFAKSDDLENIVNRYAARSCVRVAPRPPADVRCHVTAFAAEVLIAAGLLDGRRWRRLANHHSSGISRTAGKESEPPRVLLHPGAGSRRKRWPMKGFARLSTLLRDRDFDAAYIIGPAERDLLAERQPPHQPVHVLSDTLELLTLLQSAAGFIGNDSGVAHLAAWIGLASTVIFTASDPLRWRPNGPAVAAVAPGLPCRPCFETEKQNCPQPDCLRAITPETVWQSFLNLWHEQGMSENEH